MNPDILSRLFAAQGTQAQEPQWGPNPYARTPDYGGGQQMVPPQQHHHPAAAQQPLTLEQEPSDLWGQGGQDQRPMERMSSAPMGEMFGPNAPGFADQADEGNAALPQDDGSWLQDGQFGQEPPSDVSALRARLSKGDPGGRLKL